MISEGSSRKAKSTRSRPNSAPGSKKEYEAGEEYKPNKADWLEGRWAGLKRPIRRNRRGETGVDLEKLKEIGPCLTDMPEDFNINPQDRSSASWPSAR